MAVKLNEIIYLGTFLCEACNCFAPSKDMGKKTGWKFVAFKTNRRSACFQAQAPTPVTWRRCTTSTWWPATTAACASTWSGGRLGTAASWTTSAPSSIAWSTTVPTTRANRGVSPLRFHLQSICHQRLVGIPASSLLHFCAAADTTGLVKGQGQ